ncbi:MAG: hypothetical protein MJ250_06315 [Alphaproteobacteria bacterium]|nr:hypothetical protein [Alphaproteobacteria bacterium]
MKKNLILLHIVLVLFGCSSISFTEDQVLSRSDHLTKAPEWAKESQDGYPCDYSSKDKAYISKNSQAKNICFVGFYEVPEKSNTNTNMITVAAEAQAKRNFAAAVKSKISGAFNQANQDYNLNSQEASYTLSILNEASVSGMIKAGTYWERVAVTDENGTKIVRRVYTINVLSREKFEEALTRKKLSDVTKAINQRTMSYAFGKSTDKY